MAFKALRFIVLYWIETWSPGINSFLKWGHNASTNPKPEQSETVAEFLNLI
jgi:hypothetical protein